MNKGDKMDLARTIRAIYNNKVFELDEYLSDEQIVHIIINDLVSFNRMDISDIELEEILRNCITKGDK